MDVDVKEPTLEEMAAAYAVALYSPPNGIGEHVHPRFGRSDHIMRSMWARFGKEESNKAIDAAIAAKRRVLSSI